MVSGRPRVVLFSGGTACRSINVALCRLPLELTRIVPAWDSGGSSKSIRETFAMLAVGDTRQALMTMAYGEGRADPVVKIFNARISAGSGRAEARAEFDHFASGRHPLLGLLEPALRRVVLDYLGIFEQRSGPGFDFRNGSIGNFILTGAFLRLGRDINGAILEFRQLCAIGGHVWPSTTDDTVRLDAVLADGSLVQEQHRITALSPDQAEIGIAEIRLAAAGGIAVRANAAALDAVRSADLIVFGPGSLFTSLMPHLLVEGVAAELAANRGAAKVLIGNILDSAETAGMNVADMVAAFLTLASALAGGQSSALLTHVLSNAELFPFERRLGTVRYARNGPLEALCAGHALRLLIGPFEDAWNRGEHDGPAVAAALAGLLHA